MLHLLAIAVRPCIQPPWQCSNSGKVAKHHALGISISYSLGNNLSAADAYMLQRPQLLTMSKTDKTLWPSCCLGFTFMQRSYPESELTLLFGVTATSYELAMLAALCDNDI